MPMKNRNITIIKKTDFDIEKYQENTRNSSHQSRNLQPAALAEDDITHMKNETDVGGIHCESLQSTGGS